MRKIEFERWPKYKRMWKNAIDSLYPCSRRKDGGKRWYQDFGSGDALWDWWISGKGQGNERVCQGSLLFGSSEEAAEMGEDGD